MKHHLHVLCIALFTLFALGAPGCIVIEDDTPSHDCRPTAGWSDTEMCQTSFECEDGRLKIRCSRGADGQCADGCDEAFRCECHEGNQIKYDFTSADVCEGDNMIREAKRRCGWDVED